MKVMEPHASICAQCAMCIDSSSQILGPGHLSALLLALRAIDCLFLEIPPLVAQNPRIQSFGEVAMGLRGELQVNASLGLSLP